VGCVDVLESRQDAPVFQRQQIDAVGLILQGRYQRNPGNVGEARIRAGKPGGDRLRRSAAGRGRQGRATGRRGSIYKKRPSRYRLFCTGHGGDIFPADGGVRSFCAQRAFFSTTRLAKNSKPPRSMVIGWSGEMGETEFDFQTVRPSIGIFSNRSAPFSKGFPMRTAGIWRLPHQPERALEYRVRFPPCSAIYAAALEVTRIMFGSLQGNRF
jgi:hypothetical protein